MGTNYYLRRDLCEHCNRGADEIHIGKSSAGWCFSLNTHPYEGITSLDEWKRAWSQPKTAIFDEYGRGVQPSEMLSVITDRAWGGNKWTDANLSMNGAEQGPHGLARHTIDGRHCIAHGDGPYDLMRGEFS